MTPPVALAALLRRARLLWMLAGVLAVIAGLFGMHVMAAGHTAHATAAMPGSADRWLSLSKPGYDKHIHHEARHGVGHPAGHAAVGHSAAADSCGPACPSAHEMGASCTPSANSGAPTLLPPAGILASPLLLNANDPQTSGYSYLPSSPTPCELSISRT